MKMVERDRSLEAVRRRRRVYPRLGLRFASLPLVVWLGVAASGCGDVCEDAVDHLEECGTGVSDADNDIDCTGAAECLADCINDASCEDMANQAPSYSNCIAGC